MTAAHTPRTPLEVVPDPDDTIAPPEGNEWRSQTVIDQYSPEHQFVGSLMWLGAPRAQPLLDLVPDTAIWRPQTQWAYQLIRGVVATGTDPTPVAVLSAGRHQAARDAIHPNTPPTASRYRRLAPYLFDAYAQAVAPASAITTYAREVLDDAYRRAFSTCGIRMQQLAAAGADRDDLFAQFTTVRDELADLWCRAQAAALSDQNHP